MMAINHECYVSFEISKLLKDAGFDWETFGYYNKLGFFHRAVPQHDELKAPTLDVAQRWLREVKRINIEILYLFEPCNYYFARACYLDTNTPLYIPNPLKSKIYEEAQEAGIKKALEIILEKGE